MRIHLLTLFIFFLLIPASCLAAIINVPGDAASIQAGIDAATLGDTVVVAAGTYVENVTIDKSIVLFGEHMSRTIIDGSGIGDVVTVSANNTVIKRFSLTNGGDTFEEFYWYDAALKMEGADSCLIESCRLHNNGSAGMVLITSSYNTVNQCTIDNNYAGIVIGENEFAEPPYDSSYYNSFSHNNISHNSRAGIIFIHAPARGIKFNDFRANYIAYNGKGIDMITAGQNIISYNCFAGNTSYGVYIIRCGCGGEFNRIYGNCFIDNRGGAVQAYHWLEDYVSEPFPNYWYSSALKGNFWSDYTGIDSDENGIGDTWYYIDGEGETQDAYPLMAYADTDSDGVLDSVDNCLEMQNHDQGDFDGNGIGDVCDEFVCGDANHDDDSNVGDAVYIINHVFKGGPAPIPPAAGDANCDGGGNVGDAVYLIAYVFKGGEAPCCP